MCALYHKQRSQSKVEIVKVLEILNNHILKLEEDNQFKDWEIERLRKEMQELKDEK